MNYRETILNIISICTIIFLPHAELIPFFGYSVPILILTYFVLKFANQSFSDLGFSLKLFRPKSILIGLLLAVLTLGFLQLIFHPTLELVASLDSKDVGLRDTIQGGMMPLVLMIIMGWLVGGIYEEIVFHGFIFTRLEKMIKGRYSSHISFIVTSIIFGLYHIQLGSLGAINATVGGAIYLMIYLYFNRNLWYSIFCHGFYNTMVMLLIYFDYL